MAPTEVLAAQHYESFTELLESYDIKIALLTGSTKTKEKRETYQKIKDGEVDIVIGTHAVIQDKVEYNKLALVITDEQHAGRKRGNTSCIGYECDTDSKNIGDYFIW